MRKRATPRRQGNTQKLNTEILKRGQRRHLRNLYRGFFKKEMPDELLVQLEKKAISASKQHSVPLTNLGENASKLVSQWIDNEIRNMYFKPK